MIRKKNVVAGISRATKAAERSSGDALSTVYTLCIASRSTCAREALLTAAARIFAEVLLGA